jgi:hypothetical protein
MSSIEMADRALPDALDNKAGWKTGSNDEYIRSKTASGLNRFGRLP